MYEIIITFVFKALLNRGKFVVGNYVHIQLDATDVVKVMADDQHQGGNSTFNHKPFNTGQPTSVKRITRNYETILNNQNKNTV